MENASESDSHITILATPASPAVVQALYYAATGKTERLTKYINGHFVVRDVDLVQLHETIKQMLGVYNVIALTTTINISFSNHERQQFSSWERFTLFEQAKTEITLDINLKYEFLIRLPDNDKPQRYVILIEVDSSLSTVTNENYEDDPFEFMTYQIERMPSVTIRVDYVDYVLARHFSQTIESWTSTLETAKNSTWLKSIRNADITWTKVFLCFGNIGTALFIAIYTYLKGGAFYSLGEVAYLIAFTLAFGAIMATICWHFGARFTKRLAKFFIPTVLVLTRGDERGYDQLQKTVKTFTPSFLSYSLFIVINLGLNVVASFIFAWLTRS